MHKFIVDIQLPPSLFEWLLYKKFDSAYVSEIKNGEFFKGSQIIEIAKSQDRIIISKDKDFYEHFFLKGILPKIILIKIGNSSTTFLLKYFSLHFKSFLNYFKDGAGIIRAERTTINSY